MDVTPIHVALERILHWIGLPVCPSCFFSALRRYVKSKLLYSPVIGSMRSAEEKSLGKTWNYCLRTKQLSRNYRSCCQSRFQQPVKMNMFWIRATAFQLVSLPLVSLLPIQTLNAARLFFLKPCFHHGSLHSGTCGSWCSASSLGILSSFEICYIWP